MIFDFPIAVLAHAVLGGFLTLFAVCNPIGATGFFNDVVGDVDRVSRVRYAREAAIAVFVILGLSAFLGKPILDFFGITIPAFRVAGGLVILLMALQMLGGSPSAVHFDPNAVKNADDEIIVPFAMPLVAGPGSITTVINMSTVKLPPEIANLPGFSVALMSVFLLAASLWSLLFFVARNPNLIRPRVQRIFTRFMGLILAAMGCQMLILGTRDTFFAR